MPTMYEDFGEFFDRVPPVVMEFANWLMTLPEDREDDEKSAAAWCRKHGHQREWASRLQAEPEFQRLMAAKTEAMGFTAAHMRSVWENYYRLAANGSDFRAARYFLMDTKQILPPEPPKEDDGEGDVDEESLKARHREIVLGELPASNTEKE